MAKDKTHSTNYFDTFIEVAEDTKATCGSIPISKSDLKTLAEMQYEMIAKHPYAFTSDEVFFEVFARRKHIAEPQHEEARREFFSKGQPCFRASPLTKTFGFGIHADSHGKVALFGMETAKYKEMKNNASLKKVKAMRTTKS
jgi:Family of unknown function (DUF6157)